MKRLIYILLFAVYGLNIYSQPYTDYITQDDSRHDDTAIVAAPLNTPAGITRVEISHTVVPISHQRVSQYFIYGNYAEFLRKNIIRPAVRRCCSIRLSLPPQCISYPFDVFW